KARLVQDANLFMDPPVLPGIESLAGEVHEATSWGQESTSESPGTLERSKGPCQAHVRRAGEVLDAPVDDRGVGEAQLLDDELQPRGPEPSALHERHRQLPDRDRHWHAREASPGSQ